MTIKTITVSLGHIRAALEILQSGQTVSQSAVRTIEEKVREYSGAADATLIQLDPSESRSWRDPNMVVALAHVADAMRQRSATRTVITGKPRPNYLKVVQ
jgi:hypothetical protein